MLLFCEEYRMFCEIIHKEEKIQLNINGIRQLIRLLVREEPFSLISIRDGRKLEIKCPLKLTYWKIVSLGFRRLAEHPAQRSYHEQGGYSTQYLLGDFRL